MSGTERPSRLRVVAFLLVTAAVAFGVVLLLGRSQSLFSRKVALRASFDDVSGLIEGAPVRLAGLDIGIVQSIEFDPELSVKKVYLVLGIESRYLPRVRADSIARLAGKGLLGDTIVNISVGSADAKALAAGDVLRTAESASTAEVIDEVRSAITALRTLTTRVDDRVKAVLTDDLARDVGRIARSTAAVFEEVEHGRGLAHALVYDPRTAGHVREVLARGERLVLHADQTVVHARDLLSTVRDRGSLLHGLLYDPAGAALVKDLGRSVTDLGEITAEIRQGTGLAHDLVYGKEQGRLLADLAAFSRSLRRLGEGVERGEGTIGGLLRDPTVYEDLKLILGRVERNKLLKALVRFTIKTDGASR